MALALSDLEVADFAEGTIISAFGTGSTSLTLTTGHGARYPASKFRATLWQSTDYSTAHEAVQAGEGERLEVTSRSVDTLTVVRGLAGTTAISSTVGKAYTITLALGAAEWLSEHRRQINIEAYGAVGDGVSNNSSPIASAVAAAASAGGAAVYIPPGNFAYNGPISVTSSNIWFEGAPGSKLTLLNGSASTKMITFTGTAIAQLTNVGVFGLDLNGAHDGTTYVNSFTTGHGIALLFVERAYFEDNYIHHVWGDGIQFDVSTTPFNTKVFIRHNWIRSCLRNGISVVGAEECTIFDNIIDGFNTDGIDLEPTLLTYSAKLISITHNFIKPNSTWLSLNSNRLYGISLLSEAGISDEASNVQVSTNKIVGLTDTGLQYPTQGIHILDYRGYSVVDNKVYKCRLGIAAAYGTDTERSSGEIVANHVRECADLGISVRSHIAVLGNTVEWCGSCGILCNDPYNQVTGNICRNNGTNTSLSSALRSGIYIANDKNNVNDNTCYDDQGSPTQTYGVYIDDGLVGNMVLLNRCTPNLTGAVRKTTALTANNVILFNYGDAPLDPIFNRIASPWRVVTANGATPIDLSLGYNIQLNLTGNATLTFSNPRDGERYVFWVKQSGAFNITWPTVKWPAGAGAPTVTTGAGAVDMFAFMYNLGELAYAAEYSQNKL